MGCASAHAIEGMDLSEVTGLSLFYSCDGCGVNSVDDAWLFEDSVDPFHCPQCGHDLDAEEV